MAHFKLTPQYQHIMISANLCGHGEVFHEEPLYSIESGRKTASHWIFSKVVVLVLRLQ